MKTMTAKDLKNALLQEAVQGRLVPQCAADGNARTLLDAIRAEKQKSAKSKSSKPLPPIADDEIPFDIPDSWVWVRLGEIGTFVRGNGIKRSETTTTGFPCVRYGEMYTTYKTQFIKTKSFTTKDVFDKCQKIHNGDILMALTGENKWDIALAATYQGNEELALGGDLCKFTPCLVDSLFLVYIINAPFSIENKRKTATGDIIVHISADKLGNLPIPLPPLAEQRRIVSAIEKLLPLIDEYGKKKLVINALNSTIGQTAKKAILQEAVQGRLVPQCAADGNARALLDAIRAEKQKSAKTKSSKPLPPIADDEIPFEIPDSWVWVRLGEIGTFVRGNGIKRSETTTKGFPCVRYGEMYTTYKTQFIKTKSFTTKDVFDKCQKIHNGDILMALTGENKWDIALAATYQGNEELALGGDLCKFTPCLVDSLFLVYIINAPFSIENKRKTATGDIIVHISADKLGNLPIPLPPLAEQRRIVSAIEKLLPMCERLGKE